jgi:Domain of unknown function (DUF6894)
MRCYFHLENDASRILDEGGIEVADLREARTQAFMAFEEVLDEGSGTDWWRGWRLRVVDGTGNLMFLLPLGRPEMPRALTRRQGGTLPLRLASRNAFH